MTEHKSGKKRICNALCYLGVFALGVLCTWLHYRNPPVTTIVAVKANPQDYKFINPLLYLQVPEDTNTPELQILKSTITKYVANAENQKKVIDTSVYFRELNTNNWIGVNVADKYAPASLLKVATLLSFFRAYELDHSLLFRKVYLSDESVNRNKNRDYYPGSSQAKIGETYTIQDLLSYMIIDSDNNATLAIDSVIGDKIINQTFTDLKIPITDKDPDGDILNPQMVSRFFRVLYNGTYISQEFSEQALELLSHTEFTKGLVAGVPEGTVVAHKFGERTFDVQNPMLSGEQVAVRELSDCGIVYKPSDPYFICIMTKGTDFPNLQKAISDISAIVWKE